jgi:hypothetical protein
MSDSNPRGSKIEEVIWEAWSLQMETGRDHLSGKHFLNVSVIQELLQHLDVRMETSYDMWSGGKEREDQTGWKELTPYRMKSTELWNNLVSREKDRLKEENHDRKKVTKKEH